LILPAHHRGTLIPVSRRVIRLDRQRRWVPDRRCAASGM